MPRAKKIEPEDRLDDERNGIPEETPESSIPATVESTRLTLTDYHRLSLAQAMEKMTEDDWSDKILYLYRSAPFTVNKHTGQKYGTIFKTGYPGISEEEIQKNFGGGKFRAYLKMGKTTLAEQHFGPYNGKPTLKDDEQLLTQPQSESAEPAGETSNAALIGLLKEVLMEKQKRADAVGDKETSTAMQKAIELVASGAQHAQNIISKAGQAPTLNDQLTTLKTLMELSQPKEDKVTNQLLLKLMDRVMTPGATSTAGNPLDQIGSTMDLIDKLEDKFGGGGRGGSDWKLMLVQMGMKLVEHMPMIARAIQSRPVYVVPPQARIPGAVAAPIQSGSPMPTTVAAVSSPSPGFGGPPQPLDAPPETVAAVSSPSLELAPLDRIKTALVRMFYKGKGGDLAASFIEDAAPSMYENLKGKDVEILLLAMTPDPILGPLTGEPNIKEWLKEIVEYIAEGEAEAPEGEETPEPANAVN